MPVTWFWCRTTTPSTRLLPCSPERISATCRSPRRTGFPRPGRYQRRRSAAGQTAVHRIPEQPYRRHRGGGSDFFARVVAFAKQYDIAVVHDNAYSELTFDGYVAPSFLSTPGAKDVGVEFFSFSKPFNMTGWRVGFAVGNRHILQQLWRLKTNLDSGLFEAIQRTAAFVLNGSWASVAEMNVIYKRRRDLLVEALRSSAWTRPDPKPQSTCGSRAPGVHVRVVRRARPQPGSGSGDPRQRLRSCGRGVRAYLTHRPRRPHHRGGGPHQGFSHPLGPFRSELGTGLEAGLRMEVRVRSAPPRRPVASIRSPWGCRGRYTSSPPRRSSSHPAADATSAPA